jgi:hypothetical protein
VRVCAKKVPGRERRKSLDPSAALYATFSAEDGEAER